MSCPGVYLAVLEPMYLGCTIGTKAMRVGASASRRRSCATECSVVETIGASGASDRSTSHYGSSNVNGYSRHVRSGHSCGSGAGADRRDDSEGSRGRDSSDDGSDKDRGDSGGQRQLRRGRKARRQKRLGCRDRIAVPYCAETAYGV